MQTEQSSNTPLWLRIILGFFSCIGFLVVVIVAAWLFGNEDSEQVTTVAENWTPGGLTASSVAPGSQAQGGVLPHERPSYDMTTPAPMAPGLTDPGRQLALAEAQRVADENARRRREARGLAAPSTGGGTNMVRTGDNQALVMSATWQNGPWPFTVDAGNIGCVTIDVGPVLVFADANGTVWPLNGLAIAHGPQVGGQRSLNPIWRHNPQIPGTRIPLGPIMDAARSLC